MAGIKAALFTSMLAFAATSVGANEGGPHKLTTEAVPVTSAVKSDNLMKAPVSLSSNGSQTLNRSRRVKRIVMKVPATSMTRTASAGDEKRFVHSTSDMAKSKTYGETKRRSVTMPNFYKFD